MGSESIVWSLCMFLIIAEYLHYNIHRDYTVARAPAVLSRGVFLMLAVKLSAVVSHTF